MANIKLDLSYTIFDGASISFKSPADCSKVTGLRIYYPDAAGVIQFADFKFADANRNDVTDIDALFGAGAMVKVILDTDTNLAFVQNADTNAYLEGRLDAATPKTYNLIKDGETAQVKGNLGEELFLRIVNNEPVNILFQTTPTHTVRFPVFVDRISYSRDSGSGIITMEAIARGEYGSYTSYWLTLWYDGSLTLPRVNHNDMVIEWGEKDGWTYRKWSSGIAECWCSKTLENVPITTAWGNLFVTGAIEETNINLPFEFAQVPLITVTPQTVSGCSAFMVLNSAEGNMSSKTQTGTYEFVRGNSATIKVNICYEVKGRWK